MTFRARLAALLILMLLPALAAADTLQTVRSRGHIVCGVSNNVPGFSAPDAQGQWVGFDVDYCRALAAAVFANPDKAKYRPLDSGEALTALRQGEIDILARPTDWTLDLEVGGGFAFVGVSFIDGEAVLVHKALNIDSPLQLSGARICLPDQPRLRQGVAAFFDQHRMRVEIKEFAHEREAVAGYEQFQCDALADTLSRLSTLRAALTDPNAQMQLSPLLAVHPLGPVVRRGDDIWRAISQWTLLAMIQAEQAGLDQATAQRSPAERPVLAAQLLDAAADLGPRLGLRPDWLQAVIASVGNYGEVYDRNLGPRGTAGLERGLNKLWSAAGLMVPPQLR